jgi:hypothetical protein
MHTVMQYVYAIILPLLILIICTRFKKWVQKIVNEEIDKRENK